jgi:hypothetical protein
MADLTINVANIQASNQSQNYPTNLLGQDATQGEIVYLDPATNTWKKMDANASVAGNNYGDTRGMLLTGGNNGQPAVVSVSDPNLNVGPILTNGIVYCASANAGKICPITDVVSGNYPTVLGIAKSTSLLVFRPLAGGTAV